MKKMFKKMVITIVMICCFLVGFHTISFADEAEYNRYNVVFVLDASGSMNNTDPNHYRFEAIKAFTGLLAETGNNLGCVVFSDHILAKEDLLDADSLSLKKTVTDKLESASAYGYTNIGEGLSEAVNMLEQKGDKNLPSVIVFLSDGNSAMNTDEELEESLEYKANAIAEARNKGIKIYSVCLNVDASADVKEMEQISNSTGGVFKEIANVEQLNEVYDMFYELIYGSSSKQYGSKTFSNNGEIVVDFEVPSYGVEEINVVVYGKCTNIILKNPANETAGSSMMSSNTFSIAKTSQVTAGKWKAIVKGNKNDKVQINLICNNDIQVLANTLGDVNRLVPGAKVTFEAKIVSGKDGLAKASVYKNYNATLHLLKTTGEEETVEMKANGDSFTCETNMDEGTFHYYVEVSNDTIKKKSETNGPLEVSQANNTAPVAVEKEIEESVNIWPFMGGSLSLDLNGLATDNEDEQLIYRIKDSSFIENTDYTIDQNQVLQMSQFSLKKGDFVILAIDSGGLNCEIKLVVKTINIGLLTLIGLGIAAVIALIVVGILTWLALTKPFRGRVIVHSIVNGTYEGREVRKARGRIKLTIFGLQNTGLNYQKCYIQATGKRYVYFESSIPVYYGGQPTKKVKIESDIPTVIYITEDGEKQIEITFKSDIPYGYGR